MNEKKQAGVFLATPCELDDKGIAKKAEEFCKKHEWKHSNPLPDIIGKAGGKIIYFNEDKWSNISHYRNFENFNNLPRVEGSKFYIAISERTREDTSDEELSRDYCRMDFVMAQLLGHHVLHNEEQKKILCTYESGGYFYTFSNKIYLEAFIFALNLLMPEDKFIKAWEKLEKTHTMEEMFFMIPREGWFAVPRFAVEARIENLKLCRSWFKI